jgi:hypothetical protein
MVHVKRTDRACVSIGWALWLTLLGCVPEDRNVAPPAAQTSLSAEQLAGLADCLDERGWTVYVSFTCSACRLQRAVFGDAMDRIPQVECNPTADDAEPDRCLAARLTKTPTWILERDGSEVRRLAGYRTPEELASEAGCAVALGVPAEADRRNAGED